jgi:chromate reductase
VNTVLTPEGASTRHVLAIAGSLRRDSLNVRLLQAAAACAPDGMRVRLFAELGALPLLNEDEESAAFSAGPVHLLRSQVAAASALLIATPEYNHSLPGVLKNAIDWLSRPLADNVLVGKPIAVIGASAGRWGTRLAQAALRQVLFATESLVLTGPALYLADARAAFDADGTLVDAPTLASLRKVLQALDKSIFLTGPLEHAHGRDRL